ncbi:MAG: hypothetical protein H6Q65_1345 [Firmicutes bacterium]|nr:hypothetical protein [Bacillota bacterium]
MFDISERTIALLIVTGGAFALGIGTAVVLRFIKNLRKSRSS